MAAESVAHGREQLALVPQNRWIFLWVTIVIASSLSEWNLTLPVEESK
jgi:hypothetical protein